MDKITKILISLQLLGLVLGMAALVLASIIHEHDEMWNNIVTKKSVFPTLKNEQYFKLKTLSFDWNETKNKKDQLLIMEMQYGFLRDTIVDTIFIAGLAVVDFVVLAHFVYNIVHLFKHYTMRIIVWMNGLFGLLLLLLTLILKLSIDDTFYRMRKLLNGLREDPSNLDINIADVDDHPYFNLLENILSICIHKSKKDFFTIPGYEFLYGEVVLTELGFCPKRLVQYTALILVGVQGILLITSSFTAQMSICNDRALLALNQIGPVSPGKEKEVFEGPSYGFGNVDEMHQVNLHPDLGLMTNEEARRLSMNRQPYSAHFFSHPVSSLHLPFDIASESIDRTSIEEDFVTSLAELRHKEADKPKPEQNMPDETDVTNESEIQFKKKKKRKKGSLKNEEIQSETEYAEIKKKKKKTKKGAREGENEIVVIVSDTEIKRKKTKKRARKSEKEIVVIVSDTEIEEEP